MIKQIFNKSFVTNYILPVFIFTFILFLYGYGKIVHKKPYGIHYWRQADCLSYSANYYHKDLPFLEPEIYWLGSTPEGATVSEFPMIYYVTAKIWKFTGQKEIFMRLINMILVFMGLYYLFRLFREHLNERYWSYLSVLFIFSSPILVYYSNNFLSDAPAFGLALTGLYYLWKYYNTFDNKYLFIAVFLYLIAALLKISSLVGLLAVLPIHLYLMAFSKNRKINIISLIPFALLSIAIFWWYSFSQKYNQENVSGVFLQGILPIWELEKNQVNEIFTAFRRDLIPAFFNKNALYLLGLILVFSLLKFRSLNKFILAYFAFLLVGFILFFFLFYQVFNVHDYYLINWIILIPVLLLLFLDLVNRKYQKILKLTSINIISTLFVTLLIILTAQINRQKYFSASEDFVVKNGLLKINDMREWHHYNYAKTFKALENIKPFLKEKGITPEDKVISIPDESPNFSLYMLGLKGWTDFGHPPERNEKSFYNYLNLGAKYLIINDTTVFENRPFLNEFRTNYLGNFHNVYIYQLN